MTRLASATLGGIAAIALSLLGYDLGSRPGVEAATPPPEAAEAAPIPAPIVSIVGAPAFDARRFVGRVEPLRTVDIAFQVPGRIVELVSEEGARVAAGAAVARLDEEDHRLALEHAQAALALAEADHERVLELVERSVAPQAQLDRARAELRQAEVAVEQAARQLRQTVIHAPFDAFVARRLSEAWTNVTPLDPVLRLQDVTTLLVAISLPEALAVRVRAAPEAFEATARFPALPGVELPLDPARFVTEADPVAQTYTVKLAIRGGDDRILPGMTATVEVRLPEARTAVLAPVSAIDTSSGTEPRVWVVQPDGTVRARVVSLGLPQGEQIEVLEGLAADERIVAAGWRRLAEGDRVRHAGL